jgi:hypothetical protein
VTHNRHSPGEVLFNKRKPFLIQLTEQGFGLLSQSVTAIQPLDQKSQDMIHVTYYLPKLRPNLSAHERIVHPHELGLVLANHLYDLVHLAEEG